MTGRVVHAKWRQLEAQVDRLNERVSNNPDSFEPRPGSVLALDDAAGYPFMTTVALRSCLDASVDHLHALKSLIFDAGLLHVAAPFSLARGALENAAVATWILTGQSRQDRVERVARWYAENLTDWERAGRRVPIADAESIAGQWTLLDEAATRNGIRRSFRSGYTSTEAVNAAEVAFPDLRFGVSFPWQLCSGFAHGRPWAVQGGSQQQRHEEVEADMVTMRLTATLETVLYPTWAAVDLTEAFIGLYDARTVSPDDPGT